MNRIEHAQAFAHKAHDSIKQVRKYTGEPYWVHTDDVANIVENLPFSPVDSIGEREDMVCAAHLHDVIEDVMPINPYFDLYLISHHFGEHVAKLVNDLTDVYTKEAWPDLNRKQRKIHERERLGKTSPLAKTIKLADLISNTKSIIENDKDFANLYLREKFALLPYLSEGNPILLQRASIQCVNEMQQLGLTIPMVSA